MSGERFQYDDDGDSLDEIVLCGVTFHIERMSHHGWWMAVHDPETGERADFWWHSAAEPVMETDGFARAEQIIRGPLTYACPTRWTDRRYGEHRCEVEKSGHVQHRCECGATRKETP